MKHLGAIIILVILLGGAAAVGGLAFMRTQSEAATVQQADEAEPVAVEVAPIESGVIREVRTLSGSLEAPSRFNVATKVGGHIERITVDIGDQIERGQVVAKIEDSEFQQAVMQAEAELAVRKAEKTRAQSDLDLAQRDYNRARKLQERGIASQSQLDETQAALESAKAALALAEARVQQAQASLELAKIRLGYTDVRADWTGGEPVGTVGERYQDAGNTVQANDSIVSVVTLDPLIAIISITERDYARLAVGQRATLTTDALPGREFNAEVTRIAPVFRESSRQARVELRVDNPDRVLRPGMFVRLRIVLRESQAHTIVPSAAIVQRADRDVVFVVNDDSKAVREHTVKTSIEHAGMVQITEPDLTGRVVVLGQQLLGDGSPIHITDQTTSPAGANE